VISLLYLAAAGVHLGLWTWGLRAWLRLGRPAALGLVLLPSALLWYENLRTGLGRWLGPGELLYALSVPALAWHWTVLPLFVLAAWAMAREAGLSWAHGLPATIAFAGLVAALFAIDLPFALGLLLGPIGPLPEVELRLGCVGDAIRYTATLSEAYLCDPADATYRVGPGPLVAIAMVVVVLAVGLALWARRGWRWLALPAGAMFLAAGVGPALGAYAAPLANLGETVLIAGMLATAARYAPAARDSARTRTPGDPGANRMP
jgi:hypothetical protein